MYTKMIAIPVEQEKQLCNDRIKHSTEIILKLLKINTFNNDNDSLNDLIIKLFDEEYRFENKKNIVNMLIKADISQEHVFNKEIKQEMAKVNNSTTYYTKVSPIELKKQNSWIFPHGN